jgi:uncharacterized membrane protein
VSTSAQSSFPAPLEPPAKPARLDSVDLLRGLVMVVMALDHTRDYFTHLRFPPEDMANTYGWLFATRWITHLCAPAFFFLAGTGAYLMGTRGKSPAEVSHFLWTRGLWLIFLEVTIIFWGWTFWFPLPGLIQLVIFTLGSCMVVLSVLSRLPIKWLGAMSVAIIVLHNLLDPIRADGLGKLQLPWMMLHQPGFFGIIPEPPIGFFVIYPLIPWFAVMSLGYVFGSLLTRPAEERRRWLWRLGLGLTLAFIALRATNLYGNTPPGWGFNFSSGPFEVQDTWTRTIIAFLNVEKYPPSLQFLLMTLGPNLMLLAAFDRWQMRGALGWLARKVTVFGRVPLFYYILHIYLIHLMAVAVAFIVGQPAGWLLRGGFMTSPAPEGYGHNLPFIYAMWLLAVVILYPPCRWFADYKRRHPEKRWLTYL